jgi:hypothetical protein
VGRRSLSWLLIAVAVVVVVRAVAFDRHWLRAAEFILAVAALIVGAAILILSRPGRQWSRKTRFVPTYRLHNTTGDDLGLIEHPAPNVEPGDVVVLVDGTRGARHCSGRGRTRTANGAARGGHRPDAADERRVDRLTELASNLRTEEHKLEAGRGELPSSLPL